MSTPSNALQTPTPGISDQIDELSVSAKLEPLFTEMGFVQDVPDGIPPEPVFRDNPPRILIPSFADVPSAESLKENYFGPEIPARQLAEDPAQSRRGSNTARATVLLNRRPSALDSSHRQASEDAKQPLAIAAQDDNSTATRSRRGTNDGQSDHSSSRYVTPDDAIRFLLSPNHEPEEPITWLRWASAGILLLVAAAAGTYGYRRYITRTL